jgi:hypothetical protein
MPVTSAIEAKIAAAYDMNDQRKTSRVVPSWQAAADLRTRNQRWIAGLGRV